ncbi:type II toxin-antitoxin system VapC family toxin [Pleomorphovibrio marinus]|uniref:type II toxin-antitoxin system VapC family toxin n=1 Tax=Pleomorphovibrio marinus TaxID=2164132 RepID=UPI000E0CA930|nr:PIN domain-containing protein [Pleomorphovibrio marinus]
MLKGSLPEVYLDTDVAFDIISKRKPFFETAVKLIELVAQDKIALVIGECSLANLTYLSFDIYKLPDAQERLMDFISVCQVICGGKNQMQQALASSFNDKEDALHYFTALHQGVDYFITRNTQDYKNALKILPVSTPEEFLSSLR